MIITIISSSLLKIVMNELIKIRVIVICNTNLSIKNNLENDTANQSIDRWGENLTGALKTP